MRLALAATAALVLAGSAAAAPPRAGVLVPGKSLGGLRLGATPAAVARAWGRSFGICDGCPEKTWYFTYVPFQPRGAAVGFRGGRVDSLFTLWSPPAGGRRTASPSATTSHVSRRCTARSTAATASSTTRSSCRAATP